MTDPCSFFPARKIRRGGWTFFFKSTDNRMKTQANLSGATGGCSHANCNEDSECPISLGPCPGICIYSMILHNLQLHTFPVATIYKETLLSGKRVVDCFSRPFFSRPSSRLYCTSPYPQIPKRSVPGVKVKKKLFSKKTCVIISS